MENNNQEITLIDVFYYLPSKIIETKSFSTNIKFQDIIDYFNLNIKNVNPSLVLKKEYFYKKTKINESMNILDMFKENSDFEGGKLNIFIELVNT